MLNRNLFYQLYFKTTGYSFTHMGRLFLRMFAGIMLVQFGVRQLIAGGVGPADGGIPLLTGGLEEWLVIIVLIICPFFFMIGLFARGMILPPFALMIVSCCKAMTVNSDPGLWGVENMCVPFLFLGIFMFLLLVGPGKISVDYFYSLYLINRHKGKEEDLEEV